MDTPRVGSESTWSLIKTPHTLPNGTSTGYGMGLISSQYRGVSTLEHSGNWVGGNAQMLKVPSADLDIVVIVNRSDALAITLANQVLYITVKGLQPLEGERLSKPIMKGVFRSPTTGRVIQLFPGQFFSSQEVQIAAMDGAEIPVELHEDGVLRPA